MHTLFHPESVLVVGVSTNPRNMARNIVRNLIDFEFAGSVHLFGRRPGHLYGHPILTDWDDVPEGIDLAVILAPAATVPETMEQLGRRGIRRAVIESGGFAELSEDRAKLQDELLAAAHRHGIRFTGPNGLGIMNTAVGLAVPFMRMTPFPRTGRVHILAQSGGVGVFYLSRMAAELLGLGIFVSLGNKLNIDECDLLDYLRDQDPELVCLYLEDIRDGRRFFESTSNYPCPVLVHKTNVNAAGARAASSHTASLAADDRIVDAALRQAGVHRVHDMHELVTTAKALTLPPMRGDRLAVISRSGGHAVIAADLTERYGFQLPELDPETAERIAETFRAGVVRPANPLDLGDLFDFDVYVRLLEDALKSPEYDGVVFVHVYDSEYVEREPSRRLIEAVGELTSRYDKPVFLCLLTDDMEFARARELHGKPIFESPEAAMNAAALCRDRHRATQLRPEAPLEGPPLADSAGIDDVVRAARARGQRLLGVEALDLVSRAGFPVAAYSVATSAEDARGQAETLGGPVVMKIVSPDIAHKSDVGGVQLGIRDGAEAAETYERIISSVRASDPNANIQGVLLQKQEPGFREIFLGGKQDPTFGPVVMVGLGGIAVELFQDVSLRLAPLHARDIETMLDEVVSFRLLRGVRTVPAADLDFLREALARMSQLVVEHPEIQEIDLNPMKLHRAGRGGIVVDARVLLTEQA